MVVTIALPCIVRSQLWTKLKHDKLFLLPKRNGSRNQPFQLSIHFKPDGTLVFKNVNLTSIP